MATLLLAYRAWSGRTVLAGWSEQAFWEPARPAVALIFGWTISLSRDGQVARLVEFLTESTR